MIIARQQQPRAAPSAFADDRETFRLFNKFPPEIRGMIWAAVWEPRVLRINLFTRIEETGETSPVHQFRTLPVLTADPGLVRATRPARNVSLVCREAYHEMRRTLPDTLPLFCPRARRTIHVQYNRNFDLICFHDLSPLVTKCLDRLADVIHLAPFSLPVARLGVDAQPHASHPTLEHTRAFQALLRACPKVTRTHILDPAVETPPLPHLPIPRSEGDEQKQAIFAVLGN
ncbi:hypothetical protein QBC46DRAFT_395310 [Diplogelasinospora grovesii]|uniref:2EXR domain-containing protein n=1 Tax=Diplogelasinospora grovesii TaxID=303347 RepID=A0AAN6MZQ1_9PEZI|nr:hypothetical protein QBC46DRAFT_395310 [Diplogelasinospora grovesii]